MKKMKYKWRFFIIGIGVCILFLGIMCAVIQKNGKFIEEEADSVNQFTNIEEEKLFVERQLALMLESTGKVLDCEVDIIYSESEIVGANIKFSVLEGGKRNDADISKSISKALNISTESITISAH